MTCFKMYFVFCCRAERLTEEVSIVIVGKYTKLEDAYASISRSLQHAALAAGYKLKLEVSTREHVRTGCEFSRIILVAGCNFP